MNNENKNTVFFGGLKKDVTIAELQQWTEMFGAILDMRMVENTKFPDAMNFAFVSYDTPEAKDACIEFYKQNPLMVDGLQVTVSEARSQKKKTEYQGSRSNYGYHAQRNNNRDYDRSESRGYNRSESRGYNRSENRDYNRSESRDFDRSNYRSTRSYNRYDESDNVDRYGREMRQGNRYEDSRRSNSYSKYEL